MTPFAVIFSYFQMSVTWCCPSRLTVLTTYSAPTRYSCAMTPSLRRENTFSAEATASYPATACSGVSQNDTPSPAALRIGLTTIRPPSSRCQAASCAGDSTRIWRAARSPAARSVSICRYLSRRAVLSAVPFVSSPSASDSRSAISTPPSPPASTASGACAATAATVASKSPWCTMSAQYGDRSNAVAYTAGGSGVLCTRTTWYPASWKTGASRRVGA